MRRGLPTGGALNEDYVFDELVGGEIRQVRFPDLFGAERDTLFIYNLMYGPNMEAACPACTALLDGLDGHIPHLNQRIATAVVGKTILPPCTLTRRRGAGAICGCCPRQTTATTPTITGKRPAGRRR